MATVKASARRGSRVPAADSIKQVSNISSLVSEDTLRELFVHLGHIVSIDMLGPSQFNANTKEALVTFADPAAAAIAMHLTGTELGDHMLLVTSHAPAPASLQQIAAPVASLATSGFMHPSRLGPGSSVIQTTSLLGNALGQGVPGTNIKNPYVTPQLYQLDPEKADEIGRTIYVGNISLLISELDLTQMFSACGPVTFIKMVGSGLEIPRTDAALHLWNSVISYSTDECLIIFFSAAVVDAANEAIKLHGTPLAERPLKVTYSKNAINKGPKKIDSETMRRVREAELRILNRGQNLEAVAAVLSSNTNSAILPTRRRRSRSRSRSVSYGSLFLAHVFFIDKKSPFQTAEGIVRVTDAEGDRGHGLLTDIAEDVRDLGPGRQADLRIVAIHGTAHRIAAPATVLVAANVIATVTVTATATVAVTGAAAVLPVPEVATDAARRPGDRAQKKAVAVELQMLDSMKGKKLWRKDSPQMLLAAGFLVAVCTAILEHSVTES
ncbi:Protein srek1IP1 [Entophlyctis sp. JEL0112]|nr:Protein srek1IP1 [Entophlyctis sp. JEL0112]